VILLDTSGLLAAIDESQRQHDAAARVLRAASTPFLLSPFVLAELDYLVTKRVSTSAARALLEQVSASVFRLECLDASDVHAATEVIDRFGDQAVGIADASLVVLADRYDTRDVLTLDERHFRALRDGKGRPFRVLPADA
jgi:predicted nucleic acid-binding protein